MPIVARVRPISSLSSVLLAEEHAAIGGTAYRIEIDGSAEAAELLVVGDRAGLAWGGTPCSRCSNRLADLCARWRCSTASRSGTPTVWFEPLGCAVSCHAIGPPRPGVRSADWSTCRTRSPGSDRRKRAARRRAGRKRSDGATGSGTRISNIGKDR
jgi:hypothetical protein